MKYAVYASCLAMVLASAARAEAPDGIAVGDASTIALLQAEGEQIYECQVGADGALSWHFREPVAALIENGKVVGKHFAGPTWTLEDGSTVVAKVTGRAPADTAKDIPLLRLGVVARSGSGRLEAATVIQRLNTRGGTLAGPCDQVGGRRGVPYTADYAFLKAASR
jgi:hypothetical protein